MAGGLFRESLSKDAMAHIGGNWEMDEGGEISVEWTCFRKSSLLESLGFGVTVAADTF